MKLFHRQRYLEKIRGFYHAADLIKVITGVRRCGKSSLLRTIAEELRDTGTPEANILFLDLESPENRNIATADALEARIAAFPRAPGLKYLFVDEIQNVSGFESVLNAFRSTGEWSVFATGSNAYLLSGELMTRLTGRYIEFELFPLGFEEYEAMKAFYGIPRAPDSNAELNAYILEGGFPRALFLPRPADKLAYARSVVGEIFEKDIRRRVKIRTPALFATVRDYLINNFGACTSLNHLRESLRHHGEPIAKPTLQRYLQTLLDAKILCECPRFDVKSRRALSGGRKYYLSDLSFYFSQNTDTRINYGPVLENIVYLHARALGCSVSVGRVGPLECDFILRTPDNSWAYVQVAYTIALSRETEDREFRPLESIRDNYPKYVMTTDTLLQRRNGIKHVNIADFLLKGLPF